MAKVAEENLGDRRLVAEEKEVIIMANDAAKSLKQGDSNEAGNLRKAVETLRVRFSSINIETSVTDDGTALWIGLLGDEANLQDRQFLIRSFAEAVPQGFSVIGVIEHNQRSEETKPEDKAN